MTEENDVEDVFQELLSTRVDVSAAVLQACADQRDFSELAFELYKETSVTLAVCAHMYEIVTPGTGVLARNQAICAGLLVRITKFMTAVTRLASTAPRGDVVIALNRSIMESAINIRFLLHKKEERWYEQFARHSLGPERELYDIIQVNIKQRAGEVLPIEQRMLSSIDRVCRLTGVRIEDVDKKYGDWGGGLRERLKAIGKEELYSTQRIGSHAVHGTWVDLVLHHLEEKTGGYIPDSSWSAVDARLMLPQCNFASEAGQEYVSHFFGKNQQTTLLLDHIADLQSRILTVDNAEEASRAQNRKAEP
jgi:hypothetical protein